MAESILQVAMARMSTQFLTANVLQTGSYQERGVDDLWVGVVEEENEAWQAALIFNNNSPVEGVSS